MSEAYSLRALLDEMGIRHRDAGRSTWWKVGEVTFMAREADGGTLWVEAATRMTARQAASLCMSRRR
jgi:hypothetical protein